MVNSRALGLCLATFAWFASVAGEEVSFSPRDAELELLDSQGLLQASAQIHARCSCLQWSAVFGEGGLAHEKCENGMSGMSGDMFCDFTSKFHNNACLYETWFNDDASKPICLVSPNCETADLIYTPRYGTITEYKAKTCISGTDTILSELSIDETTDLASASGIDQAVLAGFATQIIDKVAGEMTEEELQAIKDSGVPTFVMSSQPEKEHEDRYHIKGNEVWVHKWAPEENDHWHVTCTSGCPSNANVTKTSSAAAADVRRRRRPATTVTTTPGDATTTRGRRPTRPGDATTTRGRRPTRPGDATTRRPATDVPTTTREEEPEDEEDATTTKEEEGAATTKEEEGATTTKKKEEDPTTTKEEEARMGS